uniref:alpha/beta fold hydrolase n=2 Tax=Candidatus Planktophila sp. TaxID=2175601 RepID=UPI0040493FB1
MKIRVALLVFSLLAAIPMPANAAEVIEKSIKTAPGVLIDTSLFLPEVMPAPAILLAHGFGSSKEAVKESAQYYRDNGYVVLTWTARGFGKSSGQISMNAAQGEIADIKELISYLVTRKEVKKESSANPIVGIVGASYGGAAALLSAAADKRIDAAIADITWNNLNQALFPQSSKDLSEPGPFKKVWTGTFFSLATLQNAALGECGALAAQWCAAYKSAVINERPSAQEITLLNSVSPSAVLSEISAPTLVSQGQSDSLFPLNESLKTFTALKKNNSAVSLIWHGGGHDSGTNEDEYLRVQYLNWFDKYLNGKDISIPTFQLTKTNGSISLQDSTVIPKNFFSTTAPDQATINSIDLLPKPALMAHPIGGIPSAISSLPGIGSAGSVAATVVSGISGFSPAFLPGQSGFLESAKLQKAVSIVGPSRIKVRITSSSGEATLFFSLLSKSASGAITQPNGVVAPIKISGIPAGGREITVELPSVILDAAVGDSLAVGISTTDQGYELPKTPSLYSITALSPLEYSVMDVVSVTGSGAIWLWPSLALLTLIVAFAFTYLRRPRHSESQRDEDFLVQVENLSKVYKDGYKAVENLSFTVSRGQVVGLLGPNGAGKTTTLRMMMGLIFPTEGAIYMDGKAVYPGSPALANLGSFVEGPGFLPHLTGRENLDLYWRSIGRTGEKYLDEVLTITKLGTALDKKVRSYSQGMRQRLAIAQAMMGMPDLLVLDEPTNGLDPQQIAEMRVVLKEYAKTGRTVIVSSHLLAEVQQTCSHVVLMHRGHLIAFGPMKKILTKNRQARSLEEIFLELIGDDLVIGKAIT